MSANFLANEPWHVRCVSLILAFRDWFYKSIPGALISAVLQRRHMRVSNHRHFNHFSLNHPSIALLVLGEGNPPVTGRFPTQRASNGESVSVLWRHQGKPMIPGLRHYTREWATVTHKCNQVALIFPNPDETDNELGNDLESGHATIKNAMHRSSCLSCTVKSLI